MSALLDDDYEARRPKGQTKLRLAPADDATLRARAGAAGVGVSEYVVALMRSKKTPEHDLRQVAALASATAAIYGFKTELAKVRNEVTGGFGLMKQAFISSPEVALRSKAELDEACRVAKAVIREAERAIARVEKAAAGPLADLEDAVDAIRGGRA